MGPHAGPEDTSSGQKKRRNNVKKIEAIVEPSEVEGVKEGLSGIGVGAVTVTEVRAFGASGGRTLVYRGVRCEAPYVTEAKLEMMVADDSADGVVTVLQRAAKTDESGVGRVFVFSLDDTARLGMAKKSVAVV
jgi:nitrogen regulatory protein P-II 1